MTITAILCVLRSERSQRLNGNETSAIVTITAIECFSDRNDVNDHMETRLYKNMIKPPANSIKKAILNYKSYISQHKWHILHTLSKFPGGGGYFHIRRSGGLAPNFASEILVGAPNFASKNINDKYPKFCPLNFRYDPKIGTFSQLLRLLMTELPKFFLLFCELGRTLSQILPPNLM